MADEHQLDDSDFGLSGIEKSQGFSKMPVSSPVDTPEPDHMSESELAHAERPVEADWGQEVERDYKDVNTGAELDPKLTVDARQAAHDVNLARESERQAREAAQNQELDEALKAHEAGQQPQQQTSEQTDIQPQAENFETMNSDAARSEADAARADADAKWAEADKAIESLLREPYARERIEQSFNHVKEAAKQETEKAHALASAAQQHYATATQNLLNEASGVIGALYPELQGLSGPQLQGALQVMAQQNPQRVQQLQHLASRAQGLVEAQARQQHEAAQGQALQREAALEQYTSANVQEYEKWTARENPETMKSIRENLKPIVEKQYGVPMQTLQAIHDGRVQMGATEFVRSAAFQKMLHDSIKYNLATRGVTQARSNPIPRVQRPGVAADGPRVHEGDLSAAASRFNLPGGNEGTQGLKNAAAWITARRGR